MTYIGTSISLVTNQIDFTKVFPIIFNTAFLSQKPIFWRNQESPFNKRWKGPTTSFTK